MATTTKPQISLDTILRGIFFGLKDCANIIASPIWGYLCDRQNLAVVGIALELSGVAFASQELSGVVDATREAFHAGYSNNPSTHGLVATSPPVLPVVADIWSSLSSARRILSGAQICYYCRSYRFLGIHAREWISPAVATYIIQQLVEVPANSKMFFYVDWYIMPVMNPDGYEYAHVYNRLWRNTRSMTSSLSCRGVDPNQNSGFKWGGLGTSKIPCSNIYKGTKAFSEPETLATSNFILGKANEIKLYLTLHSYGQSALIPWGYDVAYPNNYNDMLALAKNAVSKFIKYKFWVGNLATLYYRAAGGSGDWAKSIGIKYSYTFELADTGTYGFLLSASNILPVAQDFFLALGVFATKVATMKI
uniref:Peptidase M14 domain-containing protein n=1 Tax=Daphnia galeata TaxID=27404 RepID=A0A8J2RGL4_9CRUS|nr:unnamed protein product [Daphnia galeata]